MSGGSRMRDGAVSVSVVVLVAVLATTGAASALVITPVREVGGPGNQFLGFGGTTHFAYAESKNTAPGKVFAYVEPLDGGKAMRVNPTGTLGYPGGFDPGTGKLIYQQIDSGRSDLWFFDPDTKNRTKEPDVNSGAWEWNPRISMDHVLFARDRKRGGIWYTDLLMSNRSNGKVRTLGTWKVDAATALTGSVGERYATWTVCTASTCKAFIYDWDKRTTRMIPTKNGRPQYSPAVDEQERVVYFVRSGWRCGADVNVWRLPIGKLKDKPKKVVDLPDGIDTGWEMSLWDRPDTGMRDLLFQWYVCSAQSSDVYRAPDLASVG